MVNWMNCNQGFVMGILTSVYVVATIFIWHSNKKAANAAADQLEEMKNIQKQNVNIHLFEKRFEAVFLLNKWYTLTKSVFDEEVQKSYGNMPPNQLFKMFVFCDFLNKELLDLNKQLNSAMSYNPPNQQIIDKLNQDIATAVFQSVNDTANKIGLIEYLCPDLPYEQIKSFIQAFISLSSNISENNLLKLQRAFSELEKSKAIEEMERYLKL